MPAEITQRANGGSATRLAPSAAASASAFLSQRLASDPLALICAQDGTKRDESALCRLLGVLLRAVTPRSSGFVVLADGSPTHNAVAVWAPPSVELSSVALLWHGALGATLDFSGWARRGRVGACLTALQARRRVHMGAHSAKGFWYLAISAVAPGPEGQRALDSVLEPVFGLVRCPATRSPYSFGLSSGVFFLFLFFLSQKHPSAHT